MWKTPVMHSALKAAQRDHRAASRVITCLRYFAKTQLERTRGMRDFLPADVAPRRCFTSSAHAEAIFRAVDGVFRAVCSIYGYNEIETPVVEAEKLFLHTLGSTSDIVTKEMFRIPGEDDHHNLVLRPEGTVGVLRALWQAGLALPDARPQRLFYSGPMFRKERPQRGRFRQFDQFGVECVNEPHPEADAELIAMGARCLDQCGVLHSTRLLINTLGDEAARIKHSSALHEFFQSHRSSLSSTSQTRLKQGTVLRILDSKEPQDIELLQSGAPRLVEFLDSVALARHETVLARLRVLGVAFEEDPFLVRGLDYYSHTAFEFVKRDKKTRQTAVLAGGRYDNLLSALLPGHKPLPCVGWAAGVDRLVLLQEECQREAHSPVFRVHFVAVDVTNTAVVERATQLCERVRHLLSQHVLSRAYTGVPIQVALEFEGTVAKQLKVANKRGAHVCVVVGEDEVSQGRVTMKHLDSGSQDSVSMEAEAVVAALLERSQTTTNLS